MRWPNFPTAGSFVCDQSNIQIWMWWNCFAYARRFLESHLGLLFSFFLKWMNDSVHAMQAAWSPFGTSEPLITLPYVHLIIVQNVFRFFFVFSSGELLLTVSYQHLEISAGHVFSIIFILFWLCGFQSSILLKILELLYRHHCTCEEVAQQEDGTRHGRTSGKAS